MKLEIEITLNAPGLEAGLHSLTAFLAQVLKDPFSVNTATGDGTGTQLPPVTTGQKEAPANATEAPPENVVKMTLAEAKKAELAEEIIALGGTPPEKGAVAKFEATLEEAKAAHAAQQDGSPTGDPADLMAGTPDANTPEDMSQLNETSAEEKAPELEEVRMLAAAVIKGQNGDTALGKTKLAACLKKVGATNLTGATPDQLTAIVPLMEANAGKTLAEVVAETTA